MVFGAELLSQMKKVSGKYTKSHDIIPIVENIFLMFLSVF